MSQPTKKCKNVSQRQTYDAGLDKYSKAALAAVSTMALGYFCYNKQQWKLNDTRNDSGDESDSYDSSTTVIAGGSASLPAAHYRNHAARRILAGGPDGRDGRDGRDANQGPQTDARKPPVYRFSPAALADRVNHLPGLVGKLPAQFFTGYLPVGPSKQVFYMLILSSSSTPTTDPLLWSQTGGPGIAGTRMLFCEHGPFRVTPDSKNVVLNPDSVHSLCHGLYMDAPIGTGFSYSSNANDYNTSLTDASWTADLVSALQAFYTRFPMFTSNPLNILGNSYGGHSVPLTASLLKTQLPNIKLTGAFITQPLLNFNNNQYTWLYPRLLNSGLVSQAQYDSVMQACVIPMQSNPAFNPMNDTNCNNANGAAYGQFVGLGLDVYKLTAPQCTVQQQGREVVEYSAVKDTLTDPSVPQATRDAVYSLLPIRACQEPVLQTYLQQQTVLAALHVNVAGWQASPSYQQNGFLIESQWVYNNWSLSDFETDQTANYNAMLAAWPGLKVLVEASSDEGVCPSTAISAFLGGIAGNAVTNDFQPWYSSDLPDQVAGTLRVMNKMSFITVNGSGHLYGQYAPKRCFSMYQQFLTGTYTTTSK